MKVNGPLFLNQLLAQSLMRLLFQIEKVASKFVFKEDKKMLQLP